tara:strand:+ start:678 stop:923 length:246 start_codon:yes stop_codon:yes gene_type:complete
MKDFLSNPLRLSIFFYIIIIITILCYKPSIFYVNNNSNSKKLKIFGTGSKINKTIFPLWFVMLVVAILIYFICCLISGYVK